MACFGEWLGGDVDKGDGCIAIGPFQNIRLGNDVIQVPVREVGAWLKSRSSSDRFECAGVLIFLEIGQSAAGQNLITLDQLKGLNIGGRGQPFIEWPEILVARRQKLFEAFDHKVRLLEILNRVFGTHDALKIEGDAVLIELAD